MENKERHIIDQIKNHREAVDIDDLWGNVAPHIPKEKKKKRFGFLLFGGILVVGLLSFGFLVTPMLQREKISLAEKVESGYTNGTIIDSNIATQENSNKKETNNELYRAETISSASEKNTKNLNSDSKNNNPNTIKSDKMSSSVSTSLTQNKFSVTRSGLFVSNKEVFDSQSSIISISENDFKEVKEDKVLEERELLSIPMALGIGYTLSRNTVRVSAPNVFEPIEVLKPKVGKNRWGLYLNGGVSLLTRNLSTSNVELQSERDRRSAVVEVLGGWNVEGGIGYRLTPRISLQLGLQYFQIHERAQFESAFLVDLEGEEEGVINRKDGTIESIVGEVSSQGIRTTKEVRYNQLRLYQLPLTLNYKLLTLNKITVDVGISAAFSVRQQYDGYTSFSSSSPSYNLAEDVDGKFRSSGALSYGIHLMGSTHLSSMLDLRFGLGYTKMKNFNSEIYLIDQEYNSITLTSGFYHRF